MGLKMNIAKTKVMVVDNTAINVNNVLIIKSLFQAMSIKVICTIAQKSAQMVGARLYVCIITQLRKHTGVANKVYII